MPSFFKNVKLLFLPPPEYETKTFNSLFLCSNQLSYWAIISCLNYFYH